MIIYHYDPKTKEYSGSSDARLDPLESKKQGKDVYLLPAFATDKPPVTATPEGKTQIWNKDKWDVADIIIKPEPVQPPDIPKDNKTGIDLSSIPFIRSWIIKQNDAPEELKALEQEYNKTKEK